MKGSERYPKDEGPLRLPPLSAVECFVQCRMSTCHADLRTPDQLAGDATRAGAALRGRTHPAGTGSLLGWLWALPAATARALGLARAREFPPSE